MRRLERLRYASSAPKEHKVKVKSYEDLLEEIYEHEIGLAKMKSVLACDRSH